MTVPCSHFSFYLPPAIPSLQPMLLLEPFIIIIANNIAIIVVIIIIAVVVIVIIICVDFNSCEAGV